MTAASIGAAKAGGYARYLESKTIAPERGDYYLSPEGEPTQAPGRWVASPETLARLGIEGSKVQGRDFIALMEGSPSPHGRLAATGRCRWRSRGWDRLDVQRAEVGLDGVGARRRGAAPQHRRRREGLVIGPLKSRYSKRDLPIPQSLADRLLALDVTPDKLVFPSTAGTVLDPDNLATRVLVPACKDAGVEWAGFHTFRHTVASRLFAEGRNVVQVQRWLGHHSASFSLDTYVHMLENDLGEPLQGPA